MTEAAKSDGVATSRKRDLLTSSSHPYLLIGEPGWIEYLAHLNSRIGVLTFEPSVRFDSAGNAKVTEEFGSPRYHPVTVSEFAINIQLLFSTDAVGAVLLGMTKLLSFAGQRERKHGVSFVSGQKVLDAQHVRADLEHQRNHVTLVPTRCIAPPDFTLDRLVGAMNPDMPTMEQLMRQDALNGWSDEAQRIFSQVFERAEWTRVQAKEGLEKAVNLGLILFAESDVSVMHPAHFGQMPAGMVSSVALTMDAHRAGNSLLNDDGTIDGTRIANATEPGTTQGSKRKKTQSLSHNQRLRKQLKNRDEHIAALEDEVAKLTDLLALVTTEQDNEIEEDRCHERKELGK
ncbi:hypothetical protein [Tateyamaria sp. Alg231-49]|uniref:hypothetical protein n=1 Tax=Tateyamaria sp. Alg231-49 TaxID=1922219 RepID=UPI000D5546D4|nr:hypothetical protein [Tateyamaria sp. Alg231-49]